MTADRLHPALARELARVGRAWGALNDWWLAAPRDYAHGSPAFKWSGADPVGARVMARRFGSNTAVTSPLRDRTKEKRPERASSLISEPQANAFVVHPSSVSPDTATDCRVRSTGETAP